MVKSIKPGRIVVVTAGRFAGKKGVVLSAHEGSKEKSFGHALVVGVKLPPRKVHKKMDRKRIQQRCRVKAFLKVINFNHMMPTRHSVSSDSDIVGILDKVTDTRKQMEEKKRQLKLTEAEINDDKIIQKKEAEITNCKYVLKQEIQKVLQEKFLNPVISKTKKYSKDIVFLRQKLRF